MLQDNEWVQGFKKFNRKNAPPGNWVADAGQQEGRRSNLDRKGFDTMTSEAKHRIQMALLAAIAIAGLRTGWILYQRHKENVKAQASEKKAASLLNPDYYVTPKKLHAYDLKSAKQLTQQPVWVKEGYRYTYYPYDRARHHADFTHEAGLLLPLEKLEIKDVVLDVSPNKGEKQAMAVFEKEGKQYAVPVGFGHGGDLTIYADEMLFIQDPKELYKHWPPDVWESIDKHEVKKGMNELQADFAIGMGVPLRSDDPDFKTVNYPNGGKPVSITYQKGNAVEIKGGTPAT